MVAVDMERYSRRDNIRQYQAQQTFRDVMAAAVDAVGLSRDDWTTQQAGDGELAILPSDTSEPTVVAELVPALDRVLRQHNQGLLPEAKIRLRVAIHQGLVHLTGANGFPGEAVIEVCRLCDSDVLRQALTFFSDAAVALIVSDSMYRDVVWHGYCGIRPERFAPVGVSVKDFRTRAWIYVPDEDANRFAGTIRAAGDSVVQMPASAPIEAGAAANVSPPRPITESGYHISGITTHGPVVFGPNGVAIGSVNTPPSGGALA